MKLPNRRFVFLDELDRRNESSDPAGDVLNYSKYLG